MGFRYNQQRLEHRRYNMIGDKTKSDCGNRFIQRVHLKRLRHILSAKDRTFLRSIGLKLKEN